MEQKKYRRLVKHKSLPVFFVLLIAVVVAGSVTINSSFVQGTFGGSRQSLIPIGITTIEMTIVGDTQGLIEGEGVDNTIVVTAVAHDISVEYDNDTGAPVPSSGRIHSEFTVVKQVDKSSPKLFEALCTTEELTIALKFYRPNLENLRGEQIQYYSITLENASIVKMLTRSFDKASPLLYGTDKATPLLFTQQSGGSNPMVGAGGERPTEEITYTHMEEVSFTYGKIVWTFEPDSVEYDDDWYNPDIP